MDWYKKYQVDLLTSKNCIKFTANGQKYQTTVSYQDENTLFTVEVDRNKGGRVETLTRAD